MNDMKHVIKYILRYSPSRNEYHVGACLYDHNNMTYKHYM